MATASGFDSSIGYIQEVTPGTYLAPTRTIEHVSSSLKLEIDRIESAGIRSGRRHQGRWYPGAQRVVGKVKHELAPQQAGLLLKQLFGANITAGAGPYTHTMTPGQTVENTALTIQVGKPDEAGTVRVFSYVGCQFNGAVISAKVGETATVEFDVYGMHLDTGQSLAAFAYPATFTPFTFLHGSLSIGGSAYEVDEMTLDFKNNLKTNRHVMRTTTPSRPKISKENGFREYTAMLRSDFFDLTQLNRFINGTEAAFVATLSSGASTSLVITANARFDGEDPEISGPEMLEMGIPVKFVSTTSDAAMCTAVLTNSDPAI